MACHLSNVWRKSEGVGSSTLEFGWSFSIRKVLLNFKRRGVLRAGLSNKVFASKYKLALPSEKELRLKLKSIPRMLEDKH